ncbi:MAG: mnmE [Hydrocarboniphaga sp.]|uniref:tRNA uridine-5-carboxymethylaminomethyl(34) synthesis GTPase MnmE n=1 Tax=Hydrocarboniphaga sp. TaxID=2033016 RepID=UPI00260FA2B1|nr:tRNA uridine-5-carboxymethylaminomethyl(34) synthesis GTPase MnmE [Hydrocarboniphaga sp.]MDB5968233.1 mnmE [Hydrocarboniphaga sp.]
MTTDTIAAIATAAGRGAIGVLRLSGPLARTTAEKICGSLPPPRQAGLRAFRDAGGYVLDRGLVLSFAAPNSYSGEDLVELQAHGGPVLLDLLLQAACAAGARVARPGEFSERAFVNGRLDLAQAEAVADLIDASSREAVTAAQRSLEGEFSRQVQALADELMQIRAWIEGALDFSDEDIDWLADAQLHQRLRAWRDALAGLQLQTAQGRRLRDGLVVAIAGQPNVGKSSLLNRLAGADAAIVSDQPGTTRDVLREHLLLDGLPVTVIDTAGLRDTGDAIEREGIRRAWAAVEKAEAILFVFDDRDPEAEADRMLLARMPADVPRLLIRNKCDLSGAPPLRRQTDTGTELRVSAVTGQGFDLLRDELRHLAGWSAGGADQQTVFTARTRHVVALAACSGHVQQAQNRLEQRQPAETIAEELRLAQQELSEITGTVTTDDLLGQIFSSFCIGK